MAGVTLDQLQVPDWLAPPALERLEGTLRSPAHRERWKYTAADKVTALFGGALEQPMITGANQPGVTAEFRADADAVALIRNEATPEAFLAACHAAGVWCIDVDATLQEPLCITHGASSVPVVLRLGENAVVDLREEFVACENSVQLLWIRLERASSLTHTRQTFVSDASQWQFLNIEQSQDSRVTLHNHVVGAKLRRQDIQVALAGHGAQFTLKSTAYVPGKTHIDQQLTVQHVVGHTTSRQTVHNVAADGATAICNGRIHIHRNAPGADAVLTNRNLALGKTATINTKPELEIYTDDVKCAHGATIGQLSDDQIFYCTSRGIAPPTAKQLLSQGFLLANVDGPLRDSSGARLAAALEENPG